FTIKLYPTGSRLITVQFILNKHPIFSRVMCLLNLYLAGSRGDCRPLKIMAQESHPIAQILYLNHRPRQETLEKSVVV
nr:hypothetical protein [Nostoc sp. DedSLP05]MDZ8099310.1 hypothetical protein [Nostoc sp. DedSLP01]